MKGMNDGNKWMLSCRLSAKPILKTCSATQKTGWMNYYMKFGRSEFRKVLNYINERLTRWVMRKYKRFSKGKKLGKAYDWLVEYAAHNRNEFSHWVKGFVPYPRLG